MNEETARKNINCYFTVANRRCKVTKVATFSGTLHFGFINVGEHYSDKPSNGWIPCDFVGGCELTK